MIQLSRIFPALVLLGSPLASAEKSVLLVAGPKSHAPGEHEHPTGCEFLAKHLETSGLGIKAVSSLGWPEDEAIVAAADTLVIYSDGEDAHAAKGHLDALKKRHAAGKGLVVLHYALEPADPAMAAFLDEAIGGHFEVNWSVNPIWQMKNPTLASHPATQGVKPFELEEEFYFHIRLRDDAVPLMQAVPPIGSLGGDGPRSGNPTIRKQLQAQTPQTLAWAVANANGSRGFGFTGGHFHRNWSEENFRKLVLNAIVWTAGGDVPASGVEGKVAVTPAYQTIDEAIAKGDLADVKLHVALNPESLAKGGRPTSRPPLEQAVLRNKADIALFLIGAGADPNLANATKRTPLHLAIDRNNPQVIAALLKAGAKPDVLDSNGWTPLHYAGAKNQLETAKALLDGGANPMTLSELGGTPLHEAAASGGPEVIQLLLDHKVDPTIKSKQGVTALDLAIEYKNERAIAILKGIKGAP
jgi:Trehalose utilisation/Ankyrin repeats (3 copies)/Ankyrin repeats (many copies)